MRDIRGKITILGIAAAMAVAPMYAGKSWYLAIDDVYQVELSQVGCLVVVDESNEINVINKEGNVVLTGENVTFRSIDSELSSIETIKSETPETIIAHDNIKIIGDVRVAEVYDLSGCRLGTYAASGTHELNINIGSLPAGIYLLTTEFTGHTVKTKFVKQ